MLENVNIDNVEKLFILLESENLNIICDKEILIKYIDDLKSKSLILQPIIDNFRKEFLIKSKFGYSDIELIYLTGKNVVYPEIIELNKDIDKKKSKGDIYIKLINGNFIGYSIKQSKDATKSNYSVQKMLDDKSDYDNLTKIKLDYLIANGFPEHDDTKRVYVNKLFYPDVIDNPYWKELKIAIEKYKIKVIKGLVGNLFCEKIPYDIYEFNGEEILYLNDIMIDFNTVSFEEHRDYYFTRKNVMRKCAKLFFRLSILDKVYRVEIRWKGNIHNASPQFQIHEE